MLLGEREQQSNRAARLIRSPMGEHGGGPDRVHGSTSAAAAAKIRKAAAVRLGEPHERLKVALRARKPGAGVTEDRRTQLARGAANADQRVPARGRVADHTALADRALGRPRTAA